MRMNRRELIAAARLVAKYLSPASAEIINELANRLDITSAALSEAIAKKSAPTPDVSPQTASLLADLKSAFPPGSLAQVQTDVLGALVRAYEQAVAERDALAAENVGLKQGKPSLKAMMSALEAFYADEEVPESGMLIAFNILRGDIKTPATDRFVAEMKAQGVDSAIESIMVHMNHQHVAVAEALHVLKSHAKQLREAK